MYSRETDKIWILALGIAFNCDHIQEKIRSLKSTDTQTLDLDLVQQLLLI